jgi:hypothetical protein
MLTPELGAMTIRCIYRWREPSMVTWPKLLSRDFRPTHTARICHAKTYSQGSQTKANTSGDRQSSLDHSISHQIRARKMLTMCTTKYIVILLLQAVLNSNHTSNPLIDSGRFFGPNPTTVGGQARPLTSLYYVPLLSAYINTYDPPPLAIGDVISPLYFRNRSDRPQIMI